MLNWKYSISKVLQTLNSGGKTLNSQKNLLPL